MYIYIISDILLITKIIVETFWSRDVTDIWLLAHFELKIHKDF